LTFHWRSADDIAGIPSIEEQLSGRKNRSGQTKQISGVALQRAEHADGNANEGVDPYNTGRFDADNLKTRSR
jgi:hypothetical protein